MDGIHDLGGMSGFGAVAVEPDEPAFHQPWEAHAYALNLLGLGVLRAYNLHEYRHAVERMDPVHYLTAPYYERWFTGVTTLLTRVPRYVRGKRGVVTHVAPRFVFPDIAGHGLRAHREHTYHVEFPAQGLWADTRGSGESVIVDLWESYLEPAA